MLKQKDMTWCNAGLFKTDNTIIAGGKSQDDLKSILSIKDPSRCISQLRARKAELEKELRAFEEAISVKEKELREEMDV